MPRIRERDAPRVVYRTARCGLRVTCRQRERVFGLLRSAGDVWCCVLELAAWRRRRQGPPLAAYQELCRELAVSGPGTFGELDSTGARSVLRRYSDAWFAAAKRRKQGDKTARYPRRRHALVPVRWYAGTFTLDGRRHAQRTRDWRVGHLIGVLCDKAEAAGITVALVDERGTSSTCPNCAWRVPKPAGRNFSCPHCGQQGHRDLVAAASIAARGPGGGTIPAVPHGPGITHCRTGAHLPGVHPARRDPRRGPPSRPAPRRHLAGTGPPRPGPRPTTAATRGVARTNARSP
jgi:predicted RNA-binding Zn-ribbon protein involved in translation (DUF1610 family)